MSIILALMDTLKTKTFCTLLTLFPALVWGATFQAQVVGVTDGDTIKVVRTDHEQVKIRLSGIDCPERAQPWGSQATQAASDLVAGQPVTIQVMDIDRYGRTVGRVFVDGVNINRRLVAAGHCWTYVRYALDQHLFVLQVQAQAARIGLWQLPESERVPPWEWRKNNR